MPWVYILRGSSGRHYIGSCIDLDVLFAQHLRGHTATTKRLGAKLAIVAKKQVATLEEARRIERTLKRKKKSRPCYLLFTAIKQPRKLSGLVGSSNLPLALPYSLGLAR